MWRTFDVGAVVSFLPSDAVVVAGDRGIHRKVSRAKVAVTPEQLRRASSHELVVTSAGTILARGEGWNQFVTGLDEALVAAVAVRLDASEPLPADLMDAADRLGIPLITFPGSIALADVATVVLDALLEAQGQRLERILDIDQRFNPIVLAGGGASDIASTLYALLGCPVAILDGEGRSVVRVPAGTADDDLDSSGASVVRQPITAGDHDYGEIVVLADRELDGDALIALHRASLAIAVGRAHAAAAAAEQERFAVTSLEELIAGSASDIADVLERAASFGWDLAKPRAVLLASVDPWTESRHLPAALATIAASARATLGSDAIVWTRTSTIAALVAPESGEPGERRRIAERLRLELDQRVRSVTVSIGVGRRVDDPSKLPRSYLEASRAVDVGRWARGRHVTEIFDELGIERLLASTPADDLAEFIEQAIGRLVDHDRDHGTDLVETLGLWLETHNMAESARRMHLHHNTFKNRLERIESICGPVLTDGARSLECELAIYVYKRYDGPWRSTSKT